MALTSIMAGLRLGRFHYLLAKNVLRTFTELLSRVQKYSNANGLTNAKRGADLDPQRAGEKGKMKDEQVENRDKEIDQETAGDQKSNKASTLGTRHLAYQENNCSCR